MPPSARETAANKIGISGWRYQGGAECFILRIFNSLSSLSSLRVCKTRRNKRLALFPPIAQELRALVLGDAGSFYIWRQGFALSVLLLGQRPKGLGAP